MHIPDDLDPKSVVLIDALRFALSTEQRRMSAQAEEVVELRTETQSLRSALDRATRQLIEESRNARHRISEITILRHALEEERGKAARAEEANAALETEARDARALRKQVAAYEQSIRESNRMFHKLQQEVALHRKLGTNSEVSYPPHEAQLWMSELNDELQGALSAEELASVHDLLAREKQACKLASEAHSRAIADLEALRHSTATEVEALHQQFKASRRELEMQLESEQRSLAQTHAEAQHALDTLRRKESVEIELSAALEEVTHVAEQQKAELVMLQKLASTAQAQIARLERENGELRSAIDGMRSQRDSAITAACRETESEYRHAMQEMELQAAGLHVQLASEQASAAKAEAELHELRASLPRGRATESKGVDCCLIKADAEEEVQRLLLANTELRSELVSEQARAATKAEILKLRSTTTVKRDKEEKATECCLLYDDGTTEEMKQALAFLRSTDFEVASLREEACSLMKLLERSRDTGTISGERVSATAAEVRVQDSLVAENAELQGMLEATRAQLLTSHCEIKRLQQALLRPAKALLSATSHPVAPCDGAGEVALPLLLNSPCSLCQVLSASARKQIVELQEQVREQGLQLVKEKDQYESRIRALAAEHDAKINELSIELELISVSVRETPTQPTVSGLHLPLRLTLCRLDRIFDSQVPKSKV
jgi:hypothetical protein